MTIIIIVVVDVIACKQLRNDTRSVTRFAKSR